MSWASAVRGQVAGTKPRPSAPPPPAPSARVRTIDEALAWWKAGKAEGYHEGIAAAAEYLRASGRGDWAVVLTETLAERDKERKEGG